MNHEHEKPGSYDRKRAETEQSITTFKSPRLMALQHELVAGNRAALERNEHGVAEAVAAAVALGAGVGAVDQSFAGERMDGACRSAGRTHDPTPMGTTVSRPACAAM